MNTEMTAVAKTTELYPIPESNAALALISEVATTELDPMWNYVLRRALTTVDRQILSKRLGEIAPHLGPARYAKVAQAVLSCLVGFASKNTSDEDAEVIAAQYATMLAGLPLWAIQRACGRFGRGEVEASEVGAKHLDRAFPPSSAQLRMIAEKIVRPFDNEARRIDKALKGTVMKTVVGPAERERVSAKLEGLAGEFKLKAMETESEARAVAERKVFERTQRAVISEYQAAGVEPVVDGSGMVTSLSLLKSLGWTVEEIGNKTVLVAPAKEADDGRI